MEIDSANPQFDWVNDTYMALADPATTSHEKWAAMSQPQDSMPPSAFTFPSTLLSESSIERFGQITPPADIAPTDPENRKSDRQNSIPVDELHDELSWPADQQMQALANYQPEQKEEEQCPPSSLPTPPGQSPPQRASKRRRTAKQPSTDQSLPQAVSQSVTDGNPQPAKRKRGRPKSQPQVAYTAEGYPFEVSSARQSHLEKNRVAAHKCRQRKKEYINGLEGRAREFSCKNKALKDNVAMLREEVLTLKNEVLRHAGCGFWAVDEYLARCAGDLLGMDPLSRSEAASRRESQNISPVLSTMNTSGFDRENSINSLPSPHMDSNDDFTGFDFLEDIDEDVEDQPT
ncbi:hypothetical protein BU24DRAFT_183145 [Aaosphaeria arxii CBS 175.79]|uniref:BZIP domain-containing protein n=1 Tax=Aaosphaeria arxii CBS 175.79 TaxID=1450172 RepID=A0A6A5XS94_9PLEO|nr:uncharacterized protein BU24DRAFT_183145 [Aaosphaeria arxii CBS 175.79]KAF2015677.1 hypothetical protein BU24DRAFT_183145 [Aaosphaeria arxii CBS 175.79]